MSSPTGNTSKFLFISIRLLPILVAALMLLGVLAGASSAGANSDGWGKAARPVPASEKPRVIPVIDPDLGTPTKIANLYSDVDGDLKVDPGDTIYYQVTVTNTGTISATNVSFLDTLDANTELVTGSLRVTPMAVNDAYPALGNTEVKISSAAQGLLANDIDPDDALPNPPWNGGLVVNPAGSFSTQFGGSLKIEASGVFSYTPPAGFTGTDVFTYTVQDPHGLTDTGVVQFTISDLIWYVDNTAPAGGDGTQIKPFNSLAAFLGGGRPDGPGHIIFIYQGSGPYDSGITLLGDQKLIGQGVDFAAASGLTAPPGVTFPTQAGRPSLVNTTANNSGHGVALASGNLVRGLNVGNTPSGTGVTGASVGNLAISDMAVNGQGKGVDINGGTLAVSFDLVQVTASTNGGVSLQNVGGITTFDELDITTTGGAGFLAHSAGTVNVTGSGNTLSTANGVALDINLTTVNMTFSQVTSNGSAANGVSIAGASGTGVTITTVDIDNSTSAGIALTNNTAPVTINGGDVSGAGGAALDIDQGAANATYAGTINNSSGRSVEVTNRTGGATTISGNISDTGMGIFVNSNSGGVVTFSGSTKTLNTGASTTVTLSNNSGATINFSGGGLDIDTTSGAGFIASGGGTVNVTSGANPNTINTQTGVALNVTSTTLGANGMTFRNISAGTGASGPVNAIVLNTTGAIGFLTVTGDGTKSRNSSGGTLQRTTGDAVSLTDASNVTLQSVDIKSAGGDGIESQRGGNITLSAVLIQNPSANGWLATDLTGSNYINFGSLVTGINTSNTSAVRVQNTNANLALLELNASNFTNSTTGQSTVLFESFGSSNMRLDVLNGNIFEGLFSQAVQAAAGQSAGSTGVMTTNILNNTFRNAYVNDPMAMYGENNVGVVVANGATQQAVIQGNTFDNVALNGGIANASVIRTQNSGGVWHGTVSGNTIEDITFKLGARHGIGHVFEPPAYNVAYNTKLVIDNNTIKGLRDPSTGQPAREGILIDFRGSSGNGDVEITNNNISNVGGSQQAIEFRVRPTSATTANLLVQGNTVNGNTSTSQGFLDIDAEASSRVNATVRNNNLTNTGIGTFEISAASEDSSTTLCTDINANTLSPSPGDIEVDRIAGVFNVVQTSAANLSAVNGGATVTVMGTPTWGGAASCTLPSVAVQVGTAPLAATPVISARGAALAAYGYVPATAVTLPVTTRRAETLPAAQVAFTETPEMASLAGSKPLLLTVAGGDSVAVFEPTPPIDDQATLSGFAIPPGESIIISFRATVKDVVSAGAKQVCNQATFSGDNFTSVKTNQACKPLDASPALELDKDDGGINVKPGETIEYTLTFTNTGNQDASGVTITDTVPVSTTFNAGSSTTGWACVPDWNAGSACTLSVGSLVGGNGGGQVVFAVTVANDVPQSMAQIDNQAEIAGDSGVSAMASDSTPLFFGPHKVWLPLIFNFAIPDDD